MKVFLCQASGDKAAVRHLYKRLQHDGIEPWLDEEALLPGQEWEAEIRKAVRESDIVLVCLSKASITQRGFVQKEIKFALDVAQEQPEGTIFLIPAKLEECDVPQSLSRWQWVNLFADGGYEKLLSALRRLEGGRGFAGDPATRPDNVLGVKEAFAEAEADETKVFDSAIREPHIKPDGVASVTVNGQTLNWQLESGRVLGLRKYSKTDVRGGGITSSYPTISTAPVFTDVQVFTEFLLRNHEGTESLYRFTGGEDFVLRDGHRVTVIFSGARRSSWIALVNHDTKKWLRMGNPIDFIYATGLIKKISGWRILALFAVGGPAGAFVGVLLGMLIGMSEKSVFPMFAAGFLLPVMFGIAAKIVQWFRANSTYENQVVPVLEDLVGKLLSSTNSMA